jgi:hypothetical protein
MPRGLLSPLLFLVAGPPIAGLTLLVTMVITTWTGPKDLLGLVIGVVYLPILSLSAAALGVLAAPVCAALAVVLKARRVRATVAMVAIAATAALGADLAVQLDLHDRLLGTGGQFYNPTFKRWEAALAWAVASGVCAYVHPQISR